MKNYIQKCKVWLWWQFFLDYLNPKISKGNTLTNDILFLCVQFTELDCICTIRKHSSATVLRWLNEKATFIIRKHCLRNSKVQLRSLLTNYIKRLENRCIMIVSYNCVSEKSIKCYKFCVINTKHTGLHDKLAHL